MEGSKQVIDRKSPQPTGMQRLDRMLLAEMPARARAHFVNALSGVKGLHLLGTRSASGIENLAVFNSVIHVGASPALLGVLFRPLTARRDSYRNLTETQAFTLNLVTSDMVEAAHATSAKWAEDESEFEMTGLTPWYSDRFAAPYVAESPVRIGLRPVEEQHIRANDTRLLIGEVMEVWVPDGQPESDGWMRLDTLDIISVAGLDSYYQPSLIDRKSYAQPVPQAGKGGRET